MATTFTPHRQTNPTFTVHLPSVRGASVAARSSYVRRRIGALTFVVALVVSLGSVAQRGAADRGDDPASVATIGRAATHVVQPGDTLWSIAQRFYPGADTALVVDTLVSLNGGASIEAGERILLP